MERLPLDRQLSLLDILVEHKIIKPSGKPIYQLLIDNRETIGDWHILEHIAHSFTEVPDYPKTPEEEKLRKKLLNEFLQAGYTREQFVEMFGGDERSTK